MFTRMFTDCGVCGEETEAYPDDEMGEWRCGNCGAIAEEIHHPAKECEG